MRRSVASALLAICFAAATIPFADSQAPKVPDPPPVKAEDFSARLTGYVRPTPQRRAVLYGLAQQRHGQRLAVQAKFQTLPPAFDCREQNWVPPVGDQGNCGSCYLYSTIYGTLSSSFVRAGYGKSDGSFIMAVQYGMDCKDFGGCGGGWGSEVIDWAAKNGWPAEKWIDLNGTAFNDYPKYVANSLSCRKVTNARYWKPLDWGYATGDQADRPATVEEIKTALVNYGPLNVALDAGGQFSNGSGTITALGNNINHEIEIVAYDDVEKTVTLKNQWGKQWGNNGYRKLAYSAVSRLVDIFWVSAASLPPPPPPPPPVGVPVITSATSAAGTVGMPFSYAITATNTPTSFGVSGLPGGLGLDSGGVISGTPFAAGESIVTVSARNAAGSGTANVRITIGTFPPPPPPVPNGVGTVTWTVNGVTSSYELLPVGTQQQLQQKIQELNKILGPCCP